MQRHQSNDLNFVKIEVAMIKHNFPLNSQHFNVKLFNKSNQN